MDEKAEPRFRWLRRGVILIIISVVIGLVAKWLWPEGEYPVVTLQDSPQVKNSEHIVQQTMQDSPGGVQQNMENSPGATQLAIEHAEKVTFNAAPAPRTIPADLATALVEHLKKGEPRTIEIRSVLGDQESLGLATQIAELFEKAEWQVSKIQWSYSKPFSDIIFERGPGTLSHREFEYVMFALLKQFGHKLQLYTHRDLPPGQYRLTVGSR